MFRVDLNKSHFFHQIKHCTATPFGRLLEKPRLSLSQIIVAWGPEDGLSHVLLAPIRVGFTRSPLFRL